VKDVYKDAGVHFASTINGWSNNALGLRWLQTTFKNATKPKSDRTRRLLLVNGHSSYVNIEFINWADRYRIIIMILPPYTTHRLQPLNVGMF
jgi:DDE superfamily endonuclease